MRYLERPETSITSSSTVSSKQHLGVAVMEYSDGGGNQEGQQQQQQQPQHHRHHSRQPSGGSYVLSQESRQQPQQQQQQQPPIQQQWPAQQQHQHSLYTQHQQQQHQSYSSRHPFPQQPPDTMAAPPVSMVEHSPGVDYMSHQGIATQQPPHQASRQQYMHPGYHTANPGYNRQYVQQLSYQQQMAMQQQQQQSMAMGSHLPPQQPLLHHHPMDQSHQHLPPQQQQQLQQQALHQQPYLQPKLGRLPADRPIIKLSVSLIDTYKQINTVYYEEKDARRAARAKERQKKGQGTNNNGWDDDNYDYIISPGELFYGRYRIKERIGKGSFGQVVRAEDVEEQRDVAIKIIKSKKPFLMQAKTEIELLSRLNEKDSGDENNIVRLIAHFMYRNHQCLVFEMLSLNLYELLKNTQFGGVSLNLIRKFGKQVLKSLSFLSRPDVDIIHCDLKPENILLRHPKKSGIKVIDFGSSCRSNRRMYSYIQSRFYRSPEVILGLPYSPSIDMWSLGCILAEMHTGEPLFSGSDQFDQMQKIVKLLGMVPSHMLDKANNQHRLQFFERVHNRATGQEEWAIKQENTGSGRAGSSQQQRDSSPKEPVVPSLDPIASLSEVIRSETNRKKKHPPTETGNSPRNYELFVDLIHRMLAFDPQQRIKPEEALRHPFILSSAETRHNYEDHNQNHNPEQQPYHMEEDQPSPSAR